MPMSDAVEGVQSHPTLQGHTHNVSKDGSTLSDSSLRKKASLGLSASKGREHSAMVECVSRQSVNGSPSLRAEAGDGSGESGASNSPEFETLNKSSSLPAKSQRESD